MSKTEEIKPGSIVFLWLWPSTLMLYFCETTMTQLELSCAYPEDATGCPSADELPGGSSEHKSETRLKTSIKAGSDREGGTDFCLQMYF